MQDWQIIDSDRVPGDEGILYLMMRGTEYAIQVDGRELMSNTLHGSEDALADEACDRLARLDDARILVGGLGMGFTLAAVLRRLGPGGSATVAELVPGVVRWNRDHVGPAAHHPLRDPRVTVYEGDVGELVHRGGTVWSAILLDVDNGPGALTCPLNRWLYTGDGLYAAREALIPGGVLGIWSAADDDGFTGRLVEAGFEVEVIPYTEEGRETPDDTGTQVLWMARRPM
jgi:spermidine synthase